MATRQSSAPAQAQTQPPVQPPVQPQARAMGSAAAVPQEQLLIVPLRTLRYSQRLPEHGNAAGPERIEGPGLPQDHVLHRTLVI